MKKYALLIPSFRNRKTRDKIVEKKGRKKKKKRTVVGAVSFKENFTTLRLRELLFVLDRVNSEGGFKQRRNTVKDVQIC